MKHQGPRKDASSAPEFARVLFGSRQGLIVGSFACSMLLMAMVLLAIDGQRAPAVGGRIIPMAAANASVPLETITAPPEGLDRSRWTRIVIHHSQGRHGDAAQIARQHEAQGLAGLGYHFIIGNGRGMADGELHVGSRWQKQQPGAHVAGPRSLELNRDSIGICLVGDGRLEPFGRRQMDRLVVAVSALARELDIPMSRIQLHEDLAEVSSPGRFFPREGFYQRLAESGIPAR
ncbi:MAG: peptidoglycan recognition family protein [Planctomycetota bacterium]